MRGFFRKWRQICITNKFFVKNEIFDDTIIVVDDTLPSYVNVDPSILVLWTSLTRLFFTFFYSSADAIAVENCKLIFVYLHS